MVPEETSAPRVGFIGLGQMGSAHVSRLHQQGVPLVVNNRSKEKAEGSLGLGVDWADSPAEVGKQATAHIVFLMLTDSKAAESVCFGRKGLARTLPAGSVVANMSTITPSEGRRLAERWNERNVMYVDCPVGGSDGAARDGKVLFFVGGETADIERIRPYLEKMGRGIEIIGPVGSGNAMKLVNNLMTIGQVGLIAEALVFGEGLGIERTRLLDLLAKGGGSSAMLDNKRALFEKAEFEPHFRLALARKDLGLIESTAKQTGRSVRVVHEVRRLVDEALAQGLGDRDFAVVYEAARARAVAPGSAAPVPEPAAASFGIGERVLSEGPAPPEGGTGDDGTPPPS
ncbi:MAG: NAD(P)-dependent oxidoreductase [Thermoplasmata archaeon]